MAQPAVQKITLGDRIIRSVLAWQRLNRLLFVSPAEAQFVKVMGGRALTIGFIREHKNGFPLTFLSLGKFLERELIAREVRVPPRYVCIDFATAGARYKKGIDITSSYHQDVVADQERDDYLRARGWSMMYITATRLKRDPVGVRGDVVRFLKA